MRVLVLGTGVMLAALGAVAAPGQQRPDLSGTWKAASDPPAGIAPAPGPVFGERFDIRQDGETLTLTRPQREGSLAARFILDGRETRMRVTAPLCHGDVETIETAAWEGEALAHTIVGAVPPGGGPVSPRNVKRLFRLQAPDALVVEATMSQKGQTRQVGTVYRRTTESLPAVPPAPARGPDATIAQVAWMSGTWTGTSGQTTVEERWTPAAGGSAIGMGRTLRENVMTSFEFLCIAERGGTLVYSAMPNGRAPATHFTLTSVTPHAATFENPAHDYPQVIRYAKRPDGSLETTISAANGQRARSVVLRREGSK